MFVGQLLCFVQCIIVSFLDKTRVGVGFFHSVESKVLALFSQIYLDLTLRVSGFRLSDVDFGLRLLSLASENLTRVLDGVVPNIYSQFAAEKRGPLRQTSGETARRDRCAEQKLAGYQPHASGRCEPRPRPFT